MLKNIYDHLWLVYFYFCYSRLPLSPKIIFLCLKIHLFLPIPTTCGSLFLHCYNSVLAGIQTHESYLPNLFGTCWQIKHCFHQVLAPSTYWTKSKILILTFIAFYKITPGSSSHLQSFHCPLFCEHIYCFYFSYLKCLAYRIDPILYYFLLCTNPNIMVQVKSQLIF